MHAKRDRQELEVLGDFNLHSIHIKQMPEFLLSYQFCAGFVVS
jgi:hypothetical protein